MARPHKYGARAIVTPGGEHFDSVGEHRWIFGLRLRQRAGDIVDLERQVKFPLTVNGLKVCDLVLDATWGEPIGDGLYLTQYADFKGVLTRDARIKFKLFEAVYGRQVRVFTAKGEIKQRALRAPAATKKGRRRVNDEPAHAPAS